MAQEPNLDMMKLYLLVSAVLMCVHVGQSTIVVKWMIANPPIIFGKTAQLLCVTATPNISHTTHNMNITSWLGGKAFSTLTYTGGTADPKKYAEIRRWHRSKLESILQIYKFDEMDVNVDYSCSFGLHENRKRLSLASHTFEYHPDKDTTTVQTRFRHGYLNVTVKILKVYPIPNCTIMFNENIISQRLQAKTSANGIFYKVVEEVEHQVDVCSGQLIVTCRVGKTEIPIHQESFNRCTKPKEESPENSNMLIIFISIGVLLFVIIVIGLGSLVKYRKLRNILSCSVVWREEDMIPVRNVADIVWQLIQQDQPGAANDTGQGESHEMLSRSNK